MVQWGRSNPGPLRPWQLNISPVGETLFLMKIKTQAGTLGSMPNKYYK
jgi:hypothetical protein